MKFSRAYPSAAWITGGVYVAAFLCVASCLRQAWGFPLDDSWIHEVMARNFAETGALGFNPGKLSSGSTSILWSCLLALRAFVVPAMSPVWYCLGLSVAILFWTGVQMQRTVAAAGFAGPVAWVIALAPAANGNFLWYGLIGMEHSLFILLVVWIGARWFGARTSGDGVALGLLAAALVLARPEGLVISILLVLFCRWAKRAWRDAVWPIGGMLVGVAILAIVNWKISGQLKPLTMQGRQGLVGAWLPTREAFVTSVIAQITRIWGIHLPHTLFHGHRILALVYVATTLLFLVRGLMLLYRRRAGALLFLYVWGALNGLMYWMLLPLMLHGGRYIASTIMLFLPLWALGLMDTLEWVRVPTRIAWMPAAALLVCTAAVSLPTWESATVAGIRQINEEHAVLAAEVLRQMPEAVQSNQIAVYDIGRIGYEWRGRLIDLGGLVDPQFRVYARQGRTADYLREHGVRYMLLARNPEESDAYVAARYASTSGTALALTPMKTVCAREDDFNLSFEATSAAFRCQSLFAVRYGSSIR